jgi:hypothetical protein
MLGFARCRFQVPKFVFKSIFNFNLKPQMWRHLEVEVHSWRWRLALNIILRTGNETACSLSKIWSLRWRHTARSCWDMLVSRAKSTGRFCLSRRGLHRCFRACSLCYQTLCYWTRETTKHDFDLNKTTRKLQLPENDLWWLNLDQLCMSKRTAVIKLLI